MCEKEKSYFGELFLVLWHVTRKRLICVDCLGWNKQQEGQRGTNREGFK